MQAKKNIIMQEETMNGIGELAGNENIVIDYSDEDIIIIDNTKKLVGAKSYTHKNEYYSHRKEGPRIHQRQR